MLVSPLQLTSASQIPGNVTLADAGCTQINLCRWLERHQGDTFVQHLQNASDLPQNSVCLYMMSAVQQKDEIGMPKPLLPPPSAQDLAQKCMSAISGSVTCLCVSLGHKLGLYSTLKRIGPSTSSGLASAAGLSERWVREWLYQQAAAGFVCTDQPAETFWLSDVHADFLVEPPSLEGAKESPLGELLQAWQGDCRSCMHRVDFLLHCTAA